MEGSRTQLWGLIEQITAQIHELQQQEGDNGQELEDLSEKLQRLLVLHKKYNEMEKDSNIKLLALMRERNLYLEKCRKLENLMQKIDEKGELEMSIIDILYESND